MKIYKKDEVIYFEDGVEKFHGHKGDFRYIPQGSDRIEILVTKYPGTLQHPSGQTLRFDYLFNQVTNRDGDVYADNYIDIVDGINKGQDVNPQDQTTDLIMVKFNQVQESTTLSSAGSIDDQTITLTSATGTADGKYIILFHPASERFTTFTQIGAAVGNVITLDTPLDFDYPSGTFVDIANTDLAVDGSSTTQIFGLRGTGAPPGVDIAFDLIRMIFNCTTAAAVDLSKFGDIATGLTNGLVLRTRNTRHHNIFNLKTNADIAGIMYDFEVYDAQNLQQGQHGFVARLTIKRMGVAIRLPVGDDAEFLIRDNLSSITRLEVMAQGHIVEK